MTDEHAGVLARCRRDLARALAARDADAADDAVMAMHVAVIARLLSDDSPAAQVRACVLARQVAASLRAVSTAAPEIEAAIAELEAE